MNAGNGRSTTWVKWNTVLQKLLDITPDMENDEDWEAYDLVILNMLVGINEDDDWSQNGKTWLQCLACYSNFWRIYQQLDSYKKLDVKLLQLQLLFN